MSLCSCCRCPGSSSSFPPSPLKKNQYQRQQQQQQQQQQQRKRSRGFAIMTITTSMVAYMMTQLPAARSFSVIKSAAASRRSSSTAQFLAGAPRKKSSPSSSSYSTTSSSSSKENNGLNWETFEFSNSPKWDERFVEDEELNHRTIVAKNEHELDKLYEEETKRDSQMARRLNQETSGWQSLDRETVHRGIDVLRPFVQPERMERIQTVLQQRTQHTRFLFENPSNPSNVWACLRTMDSFGIQYVDVVIQSGSYKGKAALTQKRGMRTAMGSAKWLNVRNYATTEQAMEYLKNELGCIILASDLNPNAVDIREINWDSLSSSILSSSSSNADNDGNENNNNNNSNMDRPLCIVMGNEQEGISDVVRQYCDVTFTLPMTGFAESFNLSVATAITCAHLSAASNSNASSLKSRQLIKGPLRPGDLTDHERECLLLKGMYNSVAQKRVALALLKQANIELPPELR